MTADFLLQEGIDFYLVVEPQEAELYRNKYGSDRVLELPFQDRGTVVPARNWIKEHSEKNGDKRHWQLDDNIRSILQVSKGKAKRTLAGTALATAESFVDRYSNIAIAGFQHRGFVFAERKPFSINRQVYCCILVDNSISQKWRGKYAEDTDISLQVLSAGLCTILFHAFVIDKAKTGTMQGGNTTEIYQGDGKLQMARELQRRWPLLVEIERRFDIPRMKVKSGVWARFSQKPIAI